MTVMTPLLGFCSYLPLLLLHPPLLHQRPCCLGLQESFSKTAAINANSTRNTTTEENSFFKGKENQIEWKMIKSFLEKRRKCDFLIKVH
jgi:hypothetical protein